MGLPLILIWKGIRRKMTSGYNVIGKLPGKGKDIIIVGLPLMGLALIKMRNIIQPARAATAATLESMYKELAKKAGQLDKTIIFAMWDGSYTRDRGSIKFLEENGEQKKALVFPAELKLEAPFRKYTKWSREYFVYRPGAYWSGGREYLAHRYQRVFATG